jgi:CsoR family transcriptional regulator, copper-sensing transcriptional repressor
MDYEPDGDLVLLWKTDSERVPLLRRLMLIEGSVTGIRAMIEQDRYCPEELQQLKAAGAAIRELMMMLAEQHLQVASKVGG